MTAPPVWLAATDVALAARRHLISLPSIRAVLGASGTDPEAGWLFVRELGVVVEGSGLAAVVLDVAGGWTRPNSHNTAHFPRLLVDVYADPSRSSGAGIARPDAVARAWSVRAVLDRELHRPYAFSQVWGALPDIDPPDPGLRVWGSQSLAVPDVFPIPDWVGGARLRAEYGLSTG